MGDPITMAMVFAGASAGMQLLGGISQTMASQAAEEAAADAAEAQIQEYERQAEETRRMAQEDRSDRAKEADREFAALQVAAAEGGGLGTINMLRLTGEIGADEGTDIARITKNEHQALGSLLFAAKGEKAKLNAYRKEQKYLRQQISIGTAGSLFGTGVAYRSGAFDTKGPTGSTGSAGLVVK